MRAKLDRLVSILGPARYFLASRMFSARFQRETWLAFSAFRFIAARHAFVSLRNLHALVVSEWMGRLGFKSIAISAETEIDRSTFHSPSVRALVAFGFALVYVAAHVAASPLPR